MSRSAVRTRRRRAAHAKGLKLTEGMLDASLPEALVAGASGSTDLPLGSRDAKWDAGAARKTLSDSQFADAHFWKDPDGKPDQIGSYKLPFAEVENGKLTANWGGVTAAAQRLSSTKGVDEKAVQGKIAPYYTKAAKQYDDPSIKVPWAAETEDFDGGVAALAEEGGWDADLTEDPALIDALATVGEFAKKKKKKPQTDDGGKTDVEPDSDDDGTPGYTGEAEELAGAPETAVAPEPEAQPPAALLKWEATFAPEGKATDDGRMFWPGSIQWRELPLSLMAMTETSEGGHIGAELAGRIDEIWRDESANVIRAKGVFDNGEYGAEIARLVGDKTLSGLSVDIAARQYEIIPREHLFDEEGNLRLDALDNEPDEEPDLLEVLFGGEDALFVVTDGVIGMATVCPFPAFEDAQIALSASAPNVWTLRLQGGFTIVREEIDEAGEVEDPEETLTASAAGLAPVHPPREWFETPEASELTALTVTDDGHVYGHAAAWGTCHTGIPDACTTAPRSTTNYSYFHLAEVETEEGDTVATGRVTLATNHADRRLGRREATEHYDHTGAVVADVVATDGDHGIWISGALRPEMPAARVREFRGSVLSGDWRGVNGNLEMIALLAVNVPGFPVPRTRALVAASEEGEKVLTLVAAGIHDGRTVEDLTEADFIKLGVLAARARGGLNELAEIARGEV